MSNKILKIKLRSFDKAPGSVSNGGQDLQHLGKKNRNNRNVQAYRDRLRHDEKAWNAYKEEKNAYMREHRRTCTNAQQQRNRETAKLRMRVHRERMKANKDKATVTKVSKSTTRRESRMALEKQAYWREKQRKYRSKMSAQKQRRVREKDRKRKQQKRQERKHNDKASKTARTGMDKGKAMDIVRETIKSFGQTTQDRVARKIVTVKLAQNVKNKYLYGTTSRLSKLFGIRRGYFTKCAAHNGRTEDMANRKQRSDALSTNVRSLVQAFYLRDDVSTQLPNKRDVSKKTLLAKRVMNRAIVSAFKLWKEENLQSKLSFSKFAALRPKHIVTRNKRRREQCLCEYCENVNLKICQINKLAVTMECPEAKLQDVYDASSVTLCRKGEGQQFHDLKCLDRKCTVCGVGLLQKKFETLAQKTSALVIEWPKWEQVKEAGGPYSRKTRIMHSGSLHDLVEELCDEMKTFSFHLFVADWQKKQFNVVTKSLPRDTVVLVMDFSQNFACSFQREVQSAHWSQVQVTLHPVVAFYECPHGDGVVREAIHIISSDRCHDSHAVAHFVQLVHHHLVQETHLSIQQLIQFTDGCAGQYKSSTPFADISYATEDMKCTVDRNFFGSRHGKSESDGEGGVVKSAVTRAVTAEEVIVTDAESFFEFCNNRLTKGFDGPADTCHHFKRKFILVKKGEINRNRRSREVKTVKGTRMLHCVRSVKGGVVKTRRLSCYCRGCISSCDCFHQDYVDPWNLKMLQPLPSTEDPGTKRGNYIFTPILCFTQCTLYFMHET